MSSHILEVLVPVLPTLGRGFLVTLELTISAIAAGLVWGTILALFRIGPVKPLSWFAQGYVTLFRSVPLVMVLLWFFLVVPQVLQSLLHLSPAVDIRRVSAFVAFSLYEAAYYSEIIRAGILGVPRGQQSASLALGLTPLQTMRHVVLPQAFRAMVPVFVTQAIVMFQDTSLVYVIGLGDFFSMAESLGERDGKLTLMLMLAGATYFVICSTASMFVKFLQRKAIQ